MDNTEFIKFPKIENIKYAKILPHETVEITQKIHGTNGQILIQDGVILLGSRNRWLDEENDNHGFYKWIMARKDEVLSLPNGRYYGEFAGASIGSGEGFKEKIFILFNPPEKIPSCFMKVPVLYKGTLNNDTLRQVMDDLRTKGSSLVEGFMNVEGVVVETQDGTKFKAVFQHEETAWTKNHNKVAKAELRNFAEIDHLLQPIRLEKLGTTDSSLKDDFPRNMSVLIKTYCQDLLDEKQMTEEFYEENRKQINNAVAYMIKSLWMNKTEAQHG